MSTKISFNLVSRVSDTQTVWVRLDDLIIGLLTIDDPNSFVSVRDIANGLIEHKKYIQEQALLDTAELEGEK